MKKVSVKNLIMIIAIVLVSLALLIAVLFLMNHVQPLLNSDVRKNVEEIVTQNRDVINSKLKVEVNTLQNSAKLLEERFHNAGNTESTTFDNISVNFCKENNTTDYFIADTEGVAYFSDGFQILDDGKPLNVAGRDYFKTAKSGVPNVSERLTSRKDGNEIFIFSVPLSVDGNIIGTVQKWFTSTEMYQLCSISSFSSQGTMNIINREGYVMISSTYEESINYFNFLYQENQQSTARDLQNAINQNNSGSMELTLGGVKYFSAYTPIPEVHDWFLITSISVDAVSANSNNVILMFYFILCFLILLFAVIMFGILNYHTKQKRRLARVAFVDPITGGSTYNKFLQDLAQRRVAETDEKCGILVFDIDNFKYVNSYYGFDYGDKILRMIYNDFSKQLQSGEFLARVSNDQFIAFLKDCAVERIEKMLDFGVERDDARIYISAGLYLIETPYESPNLMMDKAATAAQAVKGATQQKLAIYSKSSDSNVIHNEQMKRKIEQALANREIIPYYQPKVNVNTGALVGAEALARWKSSDGRLISPMEFIPLAEKTGQIVDIDAAIFDQVLDFLQKNIEAGIPCLPISVNFSRMNLLGDDFIHRIVNKIEQRRLPANLIQIELTESLIFENHQTIIDFVEHLHEHGLLICIDDFGSGYSSLNMLKDIPIDVLKIDKVFLDETKNPERQHLILSEINIMANKLNMDVVVEGVETERNVLLMKKIGAEIAQGYFYARPMDEKSFQILFKNKNIKETL